MKKICLCGSTRFREKILGIMEEGKKIGIEFLFPNIEKEALFLRKNSLTPKEIKELEQEHLRAIDSVDTIYVINPGDYIGEHVKFEIKYAKENGKKVYFSEKTNSKYDKLATGIISMDSLEKLIDYVNKNSKKQV